MDRRVQEDGTIVVGGQVVPTGGSVPTVASVVSYSGNAGLQSTNVEGALDELDNEKAPNVHTHDDRYFTEVEVTNLLAGKSSTSHTHDDRYYTESEVDAKIVVINNSIAGKANTVHTHDDRYYTESEVDTKLATILASSDLHENSKMDLVAMDPNGPGNQGPITPRLVPIGYGDFWSNANGSIYAIHSADNTVRHDNQGYSYKVEHPANTGQSLDSSEFAVSPGSVVSASVWVYGDGGPRAFISLISSLTANSPTYFQPAGTTYTVETAGNFRPGPTWTKLSTSMVVPSGHTKARIMLRSYADGNSGATGGTVWWDDSATNMQVIPPSDVITGEIKMWPGTTAPGGYLLCNGATFSGTTYPGLAALLGDRFGTHSGDTYYLPDFRGRSPMGVGAAVGGGSNGNNYALGQKWGDERLANHYHDGVTSTENQYHTHGQVVGANFGGPGLRVDYNGDQPVWAYPQGIDTGTQSAFHTHNFNTNNAGGGTAGNVHPILGINFIIKAA
jgi:microcystin-dependent protein